MTAIAIPDVPAGASWAVATGTDGAVAGLAGAASFAALLADVLDLATVVAGGSPPAVADGSPGRATEDDEPAAPPAPGATASVPAAAVAAAALGAAATLVVPTPAVPPGPGAAATAAATVPDPGRAGAFAAAAGAEQSPVGGGDGTAPSSAAGAAAALRAASAAPGVLPSSTTSAPVGTADVPTDLGAAATTTVAAVAAGRSTSSAASPAETATGSDGSTGAAAPAATPARPSTEVPAVPAVAVDGDGSAVRAGDGRRAGEGLAGADQAGEQSPTVRVDALHAALRARITALVSAVPAGPAVAAAGPGAVPADPAPAAAAAAPVAAGHSGATAPSDAPDLAIVPADTTDVAEPSTDPGRRVAAPTPSAASMPANLSSAPAAPPAGVGPAAGVHVRASGAAPTPAPGPVGARPTTAVPAGASSVGAGRGAGGAEALTDVVPTDLADAATDGDREAGAGAPAATPDQTSDVRPDVGRAQRADAAAAPDELAGTDASTTDDLLRSTLAGVRPARDPAGPVSLPRLSMDLSDEGLGPLTVQAQQGPAGLQVTLTAGDRQVGEALARAGAELRRDLESGGTSLGSLHITHGDAGAQQGRRRPDVLDEGDHRDGRSERRIGAAAATTGVLVAPGATDPAADGGLDVRI